MPLFGIRRDLAGDERAVALLVAVGGAADEGLGGDHPALQIRVAAVDPGVDDRDLHRGKLGGADQNAHASSSSRYHSFAA